MTRPNQLATLDCYCPRRKSTGSKALGKLAPLSVFTPSHTRGCGPYFLRNQVSAFSASWVSMRPSPSRSMRRKSSGVPKNSRGETSPSPLRSILRNQSGPRVGELKSLPLKDDSIDRPGRPCTLLIVNWNWKGISGWTIWPSPSRSQEARRVHAVRNSRCPKNPSRLASKISNNPRPYSLIFSTAGGSVARNCSSR